MAISRYQAGTAWIRVSPDFRNFGKQLEREVKNSVNQKAAQAQINTDQARATLRELANEKVEPGVTPKLNQRALKAIETQLDSLDSRRRQAIVDVEVESIRARRELDEMTGHKRVVIEAKVDDKSATREFSKIRNELNKIPLISDKQVRAARYAMSKALLVDRRNAQIGPKRADLDVAVANVERLNQVIADGILLSKTHATELKNTGEAHERATERMTAATDGLTRAQEASKAAHAAATAASERHATARLEAAAAAGEQKAAEQELKSAITDRQKASDKRPASAEKFAAASVEYSNHELAIAARIQGLKDKATQTAADQAGAEERLATARQNVTDVDTRAIANRAALAAAEERLTAARAAMNNAGRDSSDVLADVAKAEKDVARLTEASAKADTTAAGARDELAAADERAAEARRKLTDIKARPGTPSTAADDADDAAESTKRQAAAVKELAAAEKKLVAAEKASAANAKAVAAAEMGVESARAGVAETSQDAAGSTAAIADAEEKVAAARTKVADAERAHRSEEAGELPFDLKNDLERRIVKAYKDLTPGAGEDVDVADIEAKVNTGRSGKDKVTQAKIDAALMAMHERLGDGMDRTISTILHEADFDPADRNASRAYSRLVSDKVEYIPDDDLDVNQQRVSFAEIGAGGGANLAKAELAEAEANLKAAQDMSGEARQRAEDKLAAARSELSKVQADRGDGADSVTAARADVDGRRAAVAAFDTPEAKELAAAVREVADAEAEVKRIQKDVDGADAKRKALADATARLDTARKTAAGLESDNDHMVELADAYEARLRAKESAGDTDAAAAKKELTAAQRALTTATKAAATAEKAAASAAPNERELTKRDRLVGKVITAQKWLAQRDADITAATDRETVATERKAAALQRVADATRAVDAAKAVEKRAGKDRTAADTAEITAQTKAINAAENAAEVRNRHESARRKAEHQLSVEQAEALKELAAANDEVATAQKAYDALLPGHERATKSLAETMSNLRRETDGVGKQVAAEIAEADQALNADADRQVRLAFDEGDGSSALDRLQRQTPRRVTNSKLDKDVVAYQMATQAATQFDAAQRQLQRTTDSVEAAERRLVAAQRDVINHHEAGTVATEAGIRALERETAATDRAAKARRDLVSTQANERHARGNYNNAARGVEERANLNPIMRGMETIGGVASRAINVVNERMIFAGRLLSSFSSLAMAGAMSLGALGAVNLVPLIGSIGQVGGALALLPAMAAGAATAIAAIAVGFSGIGGAFKAQQKLTEAKAKPTTGADNTKQLASAQRSAAKTAESGSRSIANAERGVQRAQKSSVEAQEDLTKARKSARDEIDEMNRSLKGLALDEEDAALSVEEARKSLRETMSDPDADATERKRANLSYRQAVENYEETRRQARETRDEVADANRKGVEGSDQVVSAQERVVNANEAAQEASAQLAQTQKDAADANAEAAERIVEAQQSMAGSDPAATAAAEMEAAMAKLAPNAQAVVAGLIATSAAWTDVRKATQQQLFEGTAEQMAKMIEVQLPGLKTGLVDVADEINGGFKHALTYMSTEKSAADMSTIFKNSADMSGSLTRGLSNVVQAFIPLSAVGSDSLPRLGGAFEDVTRKFAAFINQGQEDGSLAVFMSNMIDKTKEVGRLFYDVGRVIGGIFAGSMEQGDSMLRHFATWAKETADYLHSAAGSKDVAEFFSSVRTAFMNIMATAKDIAGIIVNSIIPAFTSLSSVLAPAIGTIVSLITTVEATLPVLKYLLTAYLAFRVATGIFGALGNAIGKVEKRSGATAGTFSQMRTAWVNAGRAADGTTRSIGRLGEAHRVLARQLPAFERFGRQYTIAAGRAEHFTRLAGTAAYGMSATRTAASNMWQAIGGGAGAALMGGVIALGLWTSATSKAKDNANALKDAATEAAAAQRGMYGAVRESRGAVDSGVISKVSQETEANFSKINTSAKNGPGVGDFLEELVVVGTGGNLWQGGETGVSKDNANRKRTADEYKPIKKVLEDLKLNADQVTTGITGTDEQWRTFRRTLQAAGPDGEAALEIFQGQRTELERTRDLIGSLSPRYLDLSDALTILADSTSTASDRAAALHNALEALIPGNEAQEALYQFGEVIDEIKEKLSSVDREDTGAGWGGEQLLNPDGTINTIKKNGRMVSDAMKAGRDNLAAMQDAGEDTTGYWATFTEEITKLGYAVDLTDVEIQEMLASVKATPEDINMVVYMAGASETMQDLAAIQATIKGLKPGQTTTLPIELKDNNSKRIIEDLGGKITWVNEAEGIATVTFDNEPAKLKMAESMALLQAINIIHAKAYIDADTHKLRLNADDAKIVLGLLDGVTATPNIDLLKKGLIDGDISSRELLTNLSTETALPKVDLDDAEFNRKMDAIEARKKAIELYDSGIGKPVDGHDGYKAPPAGSPPPKESGYWLNGEWVEPKLPGNYHGGRLAGFNLGGRMPTSGPGTETRDGIYAVGADGVPQARVNGGEWVINPYSSAKYDWLLNAINADKLAGFALGGVLPGATAAPGGAPNFQIGEVGNPFGALTAGVGQLGSMFSGVFDGQAIPAWLAFAQSLQDTAATTVQPVLSGISTQLSGLGAQFPAVSGIITPAWQAMSTAIDDAKTGTIDPVFAGIQGGLLNVQGAFATGVEAIRTQWDGVRAATADPVRFTINSVFNDGLVGMWNSVSDILGTKTMAPYVARFATGGYVAGAGGPTDDKIPAMLSNGEFVLNARATAAAGVENLRRFNGANGSPGPEGMFVGGGRLGFATGGLADTGSPSWQALKRGHAFAAKWSGTPYEWGGSFATHGGVDCSGYMSAIADVIQGGTGMMRKWATGDFPGGGGMQGQFGPQGFVKGLGAGFSIGVSQPHTAGTLGGVAGLPTINVESGGGTGGGATYGGPATGADDSQFPSQYHLPIVDGMFVSGGAGSGGSMNLGSLVQSMINPGIDKMMRNAQAYKGAGLAGGIPTQVAKAWSGSAKSKIDQLVAASTQFTGGMGAGGAVERWRPMVIAALKRNGFAATDAEVNTMLAQINSESSGDEKAIQQVIDVNSGGNEAAGLLQVIPETYETHRDPSLANDRLDPWSNMNAALRYYRATYGNDLTSHWGQGHGYDKGGIFEDGTFGFNTSGKPEAVFTADQFNMLEALTGSLLSPELFARLTGQAPITSVGRTPAPATVEVDPDLAALGDPADPFAVTEDPIDSYSGPFSDIVQKGKILGEFGAAISKPDALAKLADPDREWRMAKATESQRLAAEQQKTKLDDQAMLLRAEGKEDEAVAIDAESAKLDAQINDPALQAQMATMGELSPSEQWRQQTDQSFKQYLAENWAGMAETVIAGGIGAVGNSGAGQVIIHGGVRTNSWQDAQRSIERTQKRQSRQHARTGRR